MRLLRLADRFLTEEDPEVLRKKVVLEVMLKALPKEAASYITSLMLWTWSANSSSEKAGMSSSMTPPSHGHSQDIREMTGRTRRAPIMINQEESGGQEIGTRRVTVTQLAVNNLHLQ